MSRRRLIACLPLVASLAAFATPGNTQGIALPGPEQIAAQRAAYDAVASKTILDLQPFRAEQHLTLADGTEMMLASLSPAINSWYLLEIRAPGARQSSFYHLENIDTHGTSLALEQAEVPTLRLARADGNYSCPLVVDADKVLEGARKAGLPYAPLCNGQIYLRNRVDGSRTSRERTAEFLRNNVWFGDSLVNLVKDTFYQDAYAETGTTLGATAVGSVVEALGHAALVDHPVMSTSLDMALVGAPEGGMAQGEWYAMAGSSGVYASVVQPGKISREILDRPNETNWLDDVERGATAYLVAFDLTEFELGYEVGTDHPTLNWSPRPSGTGRNDRLPGPDGVASSTPLVTLGMVSPSQAHRVAATFTGGYKREHGAFRFGDYAYTYNGHHYGFVVGGVVLSKLVPDLATLYVLEDGTIGMRTWTVEDDALLPQIRFARQNGVPLIAPDPATGDSVPGPLVRAWGPGNWSGSAEAQLRTLRSGACMKTTQGRQMLIYAYFSTATPSAMARVFQAYGCEYAMQLDMNSVEHTYAAVYTPKPEGGLEISHLVRAMRDIDARANDGTRLPRFVAYSDNRDFFYLLRKVPPS